MAISRQKKEELIKDYVKDLQNADNLVVVKQSAISVDDSTKIRKWVLWAWWKFNIIRKRLFLKALKEAWYQDIKLEDLDGSVVALYAKWDEYWPLKVINKFIKDFKKSKKKSSFDFLWWWFEKKWFDGEYVFELANIPSKEELISKLAYLFNYPLQSFAWVLDQISKKMEDWSVKEDVKEEIKEEVKEEIKEEVKEEASTQE